MIVDRDFGIPLPDGTRLSATLWIPDDAATNPVPAILEYLPYRKSDGTLDRDHSMHPHFARNGYASLRVDRRGCGDSQGLFDDEYSEEELSDGVEIIRWIAAQPWCTGAVGMQGISWGGFNGLQIAARAPEALKAVISIGTTVDRYHDDIHYKGGIQLTENAGWASTVLSWFSMPPNPNLRDTWREDWLERLEHTPFLLERWTQHSDRDAYWKHGSICEDYSAIKAAVLVMGGLHDGYRNAMAHAAAHIKAPVKTILGPWSHKYPHITTVGPGLDYLQLALDWWEHWLKGKETGVDTLPAYSAYVMESCTPDPKLSHRPGRWVGLPEWPAPDGLPMSLSLAADQHLGAPTSFTEIIGPNLLCGRGSGEYFVSGFGDDEIPDDQSEDNAKSTSFWSDPLAEDTDLLGAPSLRLRLACNAEVGQIAIRLSDARPDGTHMLIAHGFLNLRHREGFDRKVDLVPGAAFDVEVALDQCAYRIPKGHRLCVSLSTSYWPFCWPEGQAFSLTLTGGSITLPLCPTAANEIEFPTPPPIETRQVNTLSHGEKEKTWSVEDDGTHLLTIIGHRGALQDVETNVQTDYRVEEHWRIHPDAPESARVDIYWHRRFGTGQIDTESRAHVAMRGARDGFDISQTLSAFEQSKQVFERNWSAWIPRSDPEK